MDKLSQLKRNIRELIISDPTFKNLKPIVGVVKSIEDDTCTVEISEDFSISGVKLKSTANNKDNFLLIPKVGSTVTILSLDGTVGNLCIFKIDVLEKILYNENGLRFEIDSTDGKIKIKNKTSSLFNLMQDLVNLLKGLQVYTNTGPSGNPLPNSIIAIEKFENDFKSLLK